MITNIKKEDIENKFIIDISNLQKGDIIFTTSFSYISKTIRFMTGSDFSHVMLYVDFNSIIHADGNGVHAYNTQRILFDNDKHCVIYRLKDKIDEKKLNNIIDYMRSLIGRPYSTFEAMLTKIYKGKRHSEKLFCSRLVAQAFNKEYINLVENSSYCSPEDIRNSIYLKKIDTTLRKLNENEKTIVLTKKDKPFEQAEITNHLFLEIIKLTSNKKIYDFTTLTDYLKINHQFDKDISNILKNTNYLTMWVNELKDNAPLYNVKLYNSFIPDEQKILYNEKTTTDLLNLREKNWNLYLYLSNKYYLSVFHNLLVLNSILYRIEYLRLESFQIIEYKEEKNDIMFIFLDFLVKLFFIQHDLLEILKNKKFELEYYEIILENIVFLCSKDETLKDFINKYNFEDSFFNIKNYLEEINEIFNNIIGIEIRQKRDSTIFYKKLKIKVNKLSIEIDNINFTNLFQ